MNYCVQCKDLVFSSGSEKYFNTTEPFYNPDQLDAELNLNLEQCNTWSLQSKKKKKANTIFIHTNQAMRGSNDS